MDKDEFLRLAYDLANYFDLNIEQLFDFERSARK